MEYQEFRKKVKHLYLALLLFFGLLLIGSGGLIYKIINPSFLFFENNKKAEDYVEMEELDLNHIENGIHIPTGFKEGVGLQLVISQCTPCHSAKLVTQNRATKEGWISIIRWMQETQKLWDLGQNEDAIINYLAANYAPDEKGRREILTNIEWYDLED